MSVRVRLTRVGAKKNPIWRVVVADQRSPRDGRFIETVGQYNPQTEPSTIVLDEERLQHWIARGAQPTGTVKQLMKAHAKGLKPATAAKSGAPAATAPVTGAAPEPAVEPTAPEATEPAAPDAVEASAPDAVEATQPETAEPAADEPEAAEPAAPEPGAGEPGAAEPSPE